MAQIIRSDADIGFFEVQAEAYMDMGRGSPSHAQLCALRERYALSLHESGFRSARLGRYRRGSGPP
jgi:uncharacterized protein (UPF0276 family)